MADKNLISIREFARRVGCSDTAIRKAIKSGKISKGYIGRPDGHGKIDYEAAFKEWSASYDPSYPSNEKLRAKMMATLDKQKPQTETPEAQGTSVDGASMNAAKRAQAILKAKILEIELKERQGKLVDKQQVYMALFEAGKEVKASIMAVPDRIIDAVFSAPNRNEAHTILTKALIEALDTMSDIQRDSILDK